VENQTAQNIRNFIATNFLFGTAFTYSDHDSFQEKGIIDSTGILELVAYVQQTFGIQIEDSELIPENLDSVQKLLDYITRKLGAEALKAS
jgi:acyl carrier protein